jgi:hypothetical protein
MKVDVINTKFGDIEVEYSSMTKGFFIKKYPQKLEQIAGLELLKSRDNSFKEFEKLELYVRELVKNALVDFEFERRVIIYRINTGSDFHDGLSFSYLVCDESKKNQTLYGKPNQIREYLIIDSNRKSEIGQRNIFGQLTHSDESNYVFIDYDEKIHEFLKEFTSNFHNLKLSLKDFFDKDKVVLNILNNQSGIKLLS